MRKRVYNIVIVMLLIICSLVLTSCEAITAQNINNIDSDDSINDNLRVGVERKPDVIGKIISLSIDSIRIELIESNENEKSSKPGIEKDDEKDDNNKQIQKSFSKDLFENKYTGIEKTFSVSDDVEISQGSSVGIGNKDIKPKVSEKVLDLKKGQIIMAWFKEDTEIVEKISVIQ